MRLHLLWLSVILPPTLIGLTRTELDSSCIEEAIMWEAKLDENWIPVEMNAFVSNDERFRKEGNFYAPKEDLSVFGHPVIYVGMLGFDMTTGPNATLKGAPTSVAKYIEEKYDIYFTLNNGIYTCKISDRVILTLFDYENIQGTTIVIGAFQR